MRKDIPYKSEDLLKQADCGLDSLRFQMSLKAQSRGVTTVPGELPKGPRPEGGDFLIVPARMGTPQYSQQR